MSYSSIFSYREVNDSHSIKKLLEGKTIKMADWNPNYISIHFEDGSSLDIRIRDDELSSALRVPQSVE